MKLVEQMKSSIAKRRAEENPEREANVERGARAAEKRMANRAAARLQKMNGFEMPPLPEHPVELIELSERRAQLGRDRKAIETELRQIEEKQWNEANADDDAREAVAERLAAGEIEATAQGVVPEHLEILRSRLDLVRRAENKLANRLVEGSARHNRAIAKALRPQHRVAVQRIHAALLELEAANAEEVAVRCAVPGAPLESFTFPGIGIRGPGCRGQLSYWIGYARRLGMLAEDDAQVTAAE